MAHDVFISYSSKDKLIADALCHAIEQEGIRCWIAPRDVNPGQNFAREINKAIKGCEYFVLVFSENSNAAQHVNSEINLAFNSQKTILSVKIDNAVMNESIEYYLGGTHWIDALPPPANLHFKMIIDSLKKYMGLEKAQKLNFDNAISDTENVICSVCGETTPKNSIFCSNCGRTFSMPNENQDVRNASKTDMASPKTESGSIIKHSPKQTRKLEGKKGNRRLIIGLFAAIVLIVALSFTSRLLSQIANQKNDSNDKTAGTITVTIGEKTTTGTQATKSATEPIQFDDANAVEFLKEDFDSYNVDSYPATFTSKYEGTGMGNQKVIETMDASGAYNKVFRLQGAQSWGSIQMANLTSDNAAILIIKADVKPVSGTTPGGIGLYNPLVGTWGTRIVCVSFNNSQIYAQMNGSESDALIIGEYINNNWYRVKIVCDLVKKMYDVYINNILMSSGIGMHPSVSPTKLDLTAGISGVNEIYADNLSVKIIPS